MYHSKIHKDQEWPMNNLTVTQPAQFVKAVRLHDSTSDMSREVMFVSVKECEAFKNRWEEEVSRRNNQEFLMLCIYGCIGIKRPESSSSAGAASAPPESPKSPRSPSTHAKRDSTEKLVMELSGEGMESFGGNKDPDARCIVTWGQKGLWKTDIVKNSRNPIWTGIGGGELILHRSTLEGLEDSSITIEVLDYSSGKASLGKLSLPPITTGGRKVRKLETGGAVALEVKVPSATEMEDGRLTRQWKLDHESDAVKFFNKINTNFTAVMQTTGAALSPKPTTRINKNTKEKEFKIKPYRPKDKDNYWLTKEQLMVTALKPTENFTPVASESVLSSAYGRLYVEAIHASELPNADGGAVGKAFGKKTDAFICFILDEDYSKTVTINNCLSPIWPCWEERGFIFPVSSISRVLHVGVFDSDEGDVFGGMDYDFIGKSHISLANLYSNTEYTLELRLCDSSTYTTAKRRANCEIGTVTIRLRLEWNAWSGPRRAMLHDIVNFDPSNPSVSIDLHTDTHREYTMVRDTINGAYRGGQFSMETIYAMLDELESLKVLAYVAWVTITHVLLWKSPLVSSLAFAVCWKVVSNPDLIPAFLCFQLFALLLGTNLRMQLSRSPWRRPRRFLNILGVLLLNRDDLFRHDEIAVRRGGVMLQEMENKEENRAQDEFWRNLETLWRNYNAAKKEYEDMLNSIGAASNAEEDDEAVAKNRFGVLDPVGLILAPIQTAALPVFLYLRTFTNIVVCRDSNLWFLITLSLLSLSFVLIFVPFAFLLRWIGRCLVFVLLGPQNLLLTKLAAKAMSKPENSVKFPILGLLQQVQASEDEEDCSKHVASIEAVLEARIKQEKEARRRDLKVLHRGNRILRLPKYNSERFIEYPMGQGSASFFL